MAAPLILYSDDPIGSLQRHWLAGPITDDCPRCGWHGYFRHHLATIDGNWANTLCDDCYADLNPAITVTVTFFSARSAGSSERFAVIRQRTRSDYPYPDRGQIDRKSTRLNSSHITPSRMPSSA